MGTDEKAADSIPGRSILFSAVLPMKSRDTVMHYLLPFSCKLVSRLGGVQAKPCIYATSLHAASNLDKHCSQLTASSSKHSDSFVEDVKFSRVLDTAS